MVSNSSLFPMVHALVQCHFSWAQATLFSFSYRDLGQSVCPCNCTILCIKLSLRFPLLWLVIPLLAWPLAWKVCWVEHIYTHYTPICSQASSEDFQILELPSSKYLGCSVAPLELCVRVHISLGKLFSFCLSLAVVAGGQYFCFSRSN